MILSNKFLTYYKVFKVSPILFVKEGFRRIFNVKYSINKIPVRTKEEFYFFYNYFKNKDRYEIKVENKDFFLIDKKYNIKFWALLYLYGLYQSVIAEDTLSLSEYGISKEEIKNKKVLDVGAYVGDTVIGFILKEAKYVIGYEPVFFETAQKNLEINNIKNAEIKPYGLGDEEKEENINVNYAATGAKEGNTKILIKSWKDLLENEEFDLCKVDCEGCEYYILSIPNKVIKKIPIWTIEIHGVALPIISKFKRIGYHVNLVKRHSDIVSIYKFVLS
jgi:FkbM family methyltransferase